MRSKFPEQFQKNSKKLKNIFDGNFLFVFDTNVILNLYRYSDKTKDEFLDLLRNLKDNIWIPNQVATEYFKNRSKVILDQVKIYSDFEVEISNIQKKIVGQWKHPFLDDKISKKIEKLFLDIKENSENNKERMELKVYDDDIKEEIANIFSGKVGDGLSDEEILAVFEEGEKRYFELIPPGYKDDNKGGDSNKNADKLRRFGDLLLWKEVLKTAKESNKDIILINDDLKEDWWEITDSRKTLGPRPELIKEFHAETGNIFYMYNSRKFLELAKDNFNLSDKLINEVSKTHFIDKENYSYLAKNKRLKSERLELLKTNYDKRVKDLFDYKELYDSYMLNKNIENISENHELAIASNDGHVIRFKPKEVKNIIDDLRGEIYSLKKEIKKLENNANEITYFSTFE